MLKGNFTTEKFNSLEELKNRVEELTAKLNRKVGIATNYKDLIIVY